MLDTPRTTLLAAFAGFLLECGTMPALAEAAPWQAAKVSGQAWVTTVGTKRDLVTGATLDPDVTVVTAERSRVMLVRGTETIMIGPVSVLSIAENPDQQLSTTVLQKGGTATFDVEKRNVQHFSVETPLLAAVVKGTHFTVVVGRANSTVSVDRGNVEVTALATGQVGSIGVGQHAKVDQRGLSVSGPGRHAAVTQVAPRQAVVTAISEVTPTTAVSVGEMAAAQSLSDIAAGTPAKAGLFSAITSAFSQTGQQSSSTRGVFGTVTAGDHSAHTSAAAGPAGVATSPSGGFGALGSVAGSSPSSTASAAASAGSNPGSGSFGSPANASASSATGAGPASPASSAAGTSTASAGAGTTGSASSPSSTSTSGSNAAGPGAAGSNASSAGAASSSGTGASTSNGTGSGTSTGKSDSGVGNAGAPGNGGANAGSAAGSSGGKSDNGKGNAGTPGNGGANSGASATGSSGSSSSGKSDNGKGNAGTPGNGGANNSTSGSSGKGSSK